MARHRAIHTRREIAEVAIPLQDFATQWEWCEAKPDPKISCCQSLLRSRHPSGGQHRAGQPLSGACRCQPQPARLSLSHGVGHCHGSQPIIRRWLGRCRSLSHSQPHSIKMQLNYMVLGFAPVWSTCSGLGDSSSDGTMSVATRNANMVTFVDSFG